MNVNLENPSALRRKLTIELEPAEIKTRARPRLQRSAPQRGAQGLPPRPRAAPDARAPFGDQVRGEIMQKLIKEYTDKALEEQNLKPLAAAGNRHRGERPRQGAAASARSSICKPRDRGARITQGLQGAAADSRGQRRRGGRRRLRTCASASATLKKVEDRTPGRARRPGRWRSSRASHDGKPLRGYEDSTTASWKFPQSASPMGSTRC